jgi:ABC-type multidrug transport system ATPase subunit
MPPGIGRLGLQNYVIYRYYTGQRNIILSKSNYSMSFQIIVGGHDVSSNLSEAFHELGCCPQQDQLWAALSLEDHLKGYALINGIPKADVDHVID